MITFPARGPGEVRLDKTHSALIVLPQAPHIQEQYLRGLRAACPSVKFDLVSHHSAAIEPVQAADILISFGVQLTDAVFAHGHHLKWVQALGSGVDGILDRPSLRPDILVTNMHGIHGAPCAEAAISAMFALARNTPKTFRNQTGSLWERFPVTLLEGKTVCLVGLGVIAEAMAPRCNALGMRVTAVTSTVRTVPGLDAIYKRDELDKAVAEADFTVVLVPYTSANHHLISASVIDAMKPRSFLINIARGGVVDEDALLAGLQSNQIAGAALDVFSVEPLPKNHPFWKMENVVITPHLAGYHDSYAEQALPILVHNIQHYVMGSIAEMKNIVRNPLL